MVRFDLVAAARGSGRIARREQPQSNPSDGRRRMNRMMRVLALVLSLALVAGACGGGGEGAVEAPPPGAVGGAAGPDGGTTDGGTGGGVAGPDGGSGSGSGGGTGGGSSGGDEIDLTGVDACSLIDIATVQQLTGESGEFAHQSDDMANSCFWASVQAGVPGYVEISLTKSPGGLAAVQYGFAVDEQTLRELGLPEEVIRDQLENQPVCTVDVLAGDLAGRLAVGAEAEYGICSGTQQKTYLRGFDRGVIVTLLVNEPDGSLTMDDFAAVVASIFGQL